MRKTTEKYGLAKRVMAMLLVVMMVLTTTVSAFAVDGGALGGDITAGGGDALISEGVPNNNSDSDSLESILDNIPDDPDNEDPSPDEDEGTEAPSLNGSSDEPQESNADNSLQEYVNSIFAHYTQAATPFGLLRAPRASNALSFTAIGWTGGDLRMGIGGSNPAHLSGSPGMPRMSLNGEVAFCVQWGGIPITAIRTHPLVKETTIESNRSLPTTTTPPKAMKSTPQRRSLSGCTRWVFLLWIGVAALVSLRGTRLPTAPVITAT